MPVPRQNDMLYHLGLFRSLLIIKTPILEPQLNLANKYAACANISCDYDVPQFLICGSCSEVKEISIKPDTLEELQASVQEAGFELNSPQIEMSCLCNNCQIPAV